MKHIRHLPAGAVQTITASTRLHDLFGETTQSLSGHLFIVYLSDANLEVLELHFMMQPSGAQLQHCPFILALTRDEDTAQSHGQSVSHIVREK